ncbi:MAG: hypothetical protein COA57_10655 [Flavobacteriales bacterium]|nr:DUF1573 domain-containing protein [Bacteroidales bacterium AH-315-I05]PCJ83707.1 MAG: hypothetical protein COA57_10655 [Flavobacteriales bacterium]
MESKENIKIGLLAVIALTLIFNTFMQDGTATSNEQEGNVSISKNNDQITLNPQTPDVTQTPVKPAEPEVPAGPATTIKFAEESHDFGNIKQDTENKHIFTFTNTGTEPLIISNAKGSCGCTVPKYPREPIPPGGRGEIEVEYKPGKKKGNQNQTVTITANTEPKNTQIQIKAQVEEVNPPS